MDVGLGLTQFLECLFVRFIANWDIHHYYPILARFTVDSRVIYFLKCFSFNVPWGIPMIRCEMTGRPMDSGDGIYDDGEWISWDWINGQLHQQEIQKEYPEVDPQLAMLFEELVENAQFYHQMTGRYLQIWGELGELFAKVKYGIARHKPHTQGSDGKLGNDYVEIKTISPEKGGDHILVKRAGNFSKLLVIKITEDFTFEGRFLDRKGLKKGKGAKARVSWSSLGPPEAS